MRFTWGALALLFADLYLQQSGRFDFAMIVWGTLAVTLVLAVAVDLHRRRGPGEPVQPVGPTPRPTFSLTH